MSRTRDFCCLTSGDPDVTSDWGLYAKNDVNKFYHESGTNKHTNRGLIYML